jgi:hypothetical protein
MKRHLRLDNPWFVAALAAGLLNAASGAVVANGQTSDPLREFDQRLQDYLGFRRTLAERFKPLAPTADAADLASRQAVLTAALQAARSTAKPGDLIPVAVAALIRRMVVEDFGRRTASDERATFSEVPNAARPLINKAYPVNAALPTMPPLLLSRLPRLPDNLQYRFYGRHVVLLDGDLQIIVDYILNVLPTH